MHNKKFEYLPEVRHEQYTMDKDHNNTEVIGNSACPCCESNTIPNYGDALAFICPECFWEIDLFIQSDDEPSDQNHGLTLNEARRNYRQFGIILPNLINKVKG